MTNIAKLLKDAPKGMKLYSPLFGEVILVCVTIDGNILVETESHDNRYFAYNGVFRMDGTYPNAECLLFPSNKVRTWVGWKAPVEPKFKYGTWLWHKENGDFPVLIVGYDEKKGYLAKYNIGLETYFGRDIIENYYRLWEISDARNGDVLVVNGSSKQYKWIGIFKAHTSDTSFSSHCHYNCGTCEFVTHIARCTKHGTGKYSDIRPATNEERDMLFAKMKEAGYTWDSEKKELKKVQPHYDITNFKDGMAVLVRDGNEDKWTYLLFSDIDNDIEDKFIAGASAWKQCIPFDGNEKLLGTTDQCDERFINW